MEICLKDLKPKVRKKVEKEIKDGKHGDLARMAFKDGCKMIIINTDKIVWDWE